MLTRKTTRIAVRTFERLTITTVQNEASVCTVCHQVTPTHWRVEKESLENPELQTKAVLGNAIQELQKTTDD